LTSGRNSLFEEQLTFWIKYFNAKDRFSNVAILVTKTYAFPIQYKNFLQTADLVSNLGGSLGLLTGMAIIMIFEILELICDLFFAVWRYMTAKKRPIMSAKGNKKVQHSFSYD